jgi:hypothetical protein
VYKYIERMRELKDEKFAHFSGPDGERSWIQLVDDSEKILNGYTLSREAQGKEDFQSNMMDNISRAKMRAIAAGVGLKTPQMEFEMINDEGVPSPYRAELFKNVVKHTFEDGNPALHSYQEVWHMLSHGVLFEYEGFKTGGAMREVVKSFDTRTGEIETKKEYVAGYGKPFSVILNPQEFYWWDMYVRDVQDQPRIAWVQHYTKAQCQLEFGKYKNYKYLKDKQNAQKILSLQDTYFFDKWGKNVEDEDDYEVVRLYSKEDNLDDDSPCTGYEVWVNGVPMLRAPLLWGKEDPMYPFAKTLAEPYANTNFFVGMPFGQIVEAYQETKNAVLNTMVDKLYRSMAKPFLVGLGNMDVLDWEGKYVNQDNRFYVPDINQVKPFPYEGLNSGEFQMLQVLGQGIESMSVDRAQQGQASGGGKTAREVVIANQRAQEMKGILFLALEDLWYQKTKLRTQIVITHYLQDRAAQKSKKNNIISIPDYQFADGARGTLALHIAKTEGKMMSRLDVEARADAMEREGKPYKMISLPATYFDDWQYDFKIVPQSLREQEKVTEQDELMGEIQQVSTLFPEFFVANRDKYLQEILALRGKHPSEFSAPIQASPQPTPQDGSTPTQPTPQAQSSPESVLGLQ